MFDLIYSSVLKGSQEVIAPEETDGEISAVVTNLCPKILCRLLKRHEWQHIVKHVSQIEQDVGQDVMHYNDTFPQSLFFSELSICQGIVGNKYSQNSKGTAESHTVREL